MTRGQLPIATTFHIGKVDPDENDGALPSEAPVELRTDAATVQISEELHDRVRAAAERRGVPMTEIVELALAEPLGTPAPHKVARNRDGQKTSRKGRPTISLSAGFYEKLRAAADERGVSMASIVEDAVADVGGA